MIDSAPQIMSLPIDLDEDLIQMPLPARKVYSRHVASFPEFPREQRAETVPPEPHGFMAYIDTALMQQVLDLAQRQWEPEIHHHGKPDDLGRSLEISEWIRHPTTLLLQRPMLNRFSSDSP